jgi:hypothetical protein
VPTPDGIPDHRDIDSDNDGICDGDHSSVEGVCPNWTEVDRDPGDAELFSAHGPAGCPHNRKPVIGSRKGV